MDIKLSQLAEDKIKEAIKENNEQPNLRIYVEKVGCAGARFGISFDDIKENDTVTAVNGINIITDNEFIPKHSDGIDIDYVVEPKEGFIIKSLRPIKKSCSGCSGCH